MKTLLILCLLLSGTGLFAADLTMAITKANHSEKEALNKAFKKLSLLLPEKFINGLPKDLTLQVETLSDHESLPVDLCQKMVDPAKNRAINSKPFIYGDYNHRLKILRLNRAVVNELIKGVVGSPKISCQHKTLYDQAFSTLVHELAHAYDWNNSNISTSIEFLQKAGFKKGLLKIKNRNSEAMRPADPYELQNSSEAFAVNVEYFLMDPEFACRRPAMADFMKTIFGNLNLNEANCSLNHTVMMSTSSGFYPVSLNPLRVYRIDYLLAAPGSDLSSGFGHSMFRIVMCAPERRDPITGTIVPATPFGKKCLEDKLYHLVVSYRANVEDATLNYLKGLTGGYPSILFILNFGDVLDEYNRDELRDVVSYPLKLSEKEKGDILKKVLEDHWNYRGSYKFITNNCAVESYNLLAGALERSDLNKHHSVSPKGVLEDLDRLEFVSLKSGEQEIYKARTEQLVLAMSTSYGVTPATEKKNKENLSKFAKESKALDRRLVFEAFINEKQASENLHDELASLKKRLVKASSFSVLEQHVLRMKASEFRKAAAEFLMNQNAKDQEVEELNQAAQRALKRNFTDLSKTGYGVPLEEELLTSDEMETKKSASKEVSADLEILLKQRMPEQIRTLEFINENIDLFNEHSLKIRKLFREKLEAYCLLVIKNLTLEENVRKLLLSALQSKTDLDKVRSLLDSSLVSDKEIVDGKLRKIITELLGA